MKFRKGFTTMKKALSLVICIALIMSVLPLTTFAVDIVESGQCGDNLTWALDSEGTLTISGTGDMYDYDYGEDMSPTAPWDEFDPRLKSLVIEDGVTSIGDYAFMNCRGFINTLTIPNSVTRIGNYAFYSCDGFVENLTLSDDLITIGNNAFFGCSGFTGELIIPQSVNEIGNLAFYNCSGLSVIKFKGNPPSVGTNFVDTSTITLYVPSGNSNWTVPNWNGYNTAWYIQDNNSTENDPEKCGDNLTWELDKYGILTISGTGTMWNYSNNGSTIAPWNTDKDKIRIVVLTEGVTSLGDMSFDGCTNLEYMILPNSITSISNSAFNGCSKLTNIYYAGNQTKWDEISANINLGFLPEDAYLSTRYDFNGYMGFCGDNLIWELNGVWDGTLIISGIGNMYDFDSREDAPWQKYNNEITDITMWSGVTSIGKNAFKGLNALNSVSDFPDTLVSIGDFAFPSINYLRTSLTIPKNVTTIGKGAFSEWTDIEKVYMKGNAPTVGADAFSQAVTLYVPYQNSTWSVPSWNGYNTVWDTPTGATIDECGDNATWTLDNTGVLTISGTGAMWDDYNFPTNMGNSEDDLSITSVVIEQGITSIANNAFENCYMLEIVSISNTVTRIGDYAFSDCRRLNTIDLGDGIRYIGKYAFLDCEELSSIIIPYGVTIINSQIFSGCSKLQNVIIPNSVTYIDNQAFIGCGSLRSINIPNSVDGLGDDVFGSSAITDLYYGGTEGKWNAIAFYYDGTPKVNATMHFANPATEGLEYTLLDDGTYEVSGIGSANIQHICIPSSHSGKAVTKIGNDAFKECTQLISVTISDGISSIGNQAFYGCTNITDIVFLGEVTSIGEAAFANCTNLTDTILPNGLTNIGASAFNWCEMLMNMTIPNGVTNIGAGAFASCSRLEKVIIPDSVKVIGEAAFASCELLSDIDIPVGVTNIENNTFMNCSSLTDITIPIGVINIGENAFYYCENIENVTIPNGLKTIGKSAFYNCNKLSSINLPESVTTLGDASFAYCENLIDIDIPLSVSSIGKSAFRNCGLTSIILPDYLMVIEESTFSDCVRLVQIDIPDSVSIIGCSAFSGCEALNDVYYSGTEELWNLIDIEDDNDYLISANLHFASLITKTIGGTLRTDDKWTVDWYCTYKEDESGNLSDGKLTISIVVTGVNDSSSEEDIYIYNENGENEYEFPWESSGNLNLKDIITRIEIKGQSGYNLHIIVDMFKNYDSLENVNCSYVSGIDGNAFEDCNNLKTVTISNSERFASFSSKAFRNCTSLSYVDFPESTKHINDFAFQNTALTNIYLGENVIEIGDSAFEGCTNLTNVEFPVDLQTIEDNAFKNTNIGIITLYEMIETIGNNAFSGCENIFIKCYKNSVAHSYAIDNNIPFGFYNSITDIYYTDSNGVYQTETLPWSLENLISQTSSTTYSPEIAYMLAALSMAAYDEYNVSRSMHSLGMTNTVSRYSTDSIIDYSFGQLKMLDGRKLVLIDIQGTKGELNIFNLPTQWGSNFTLGGALFGASMHQGFEEALNVVYSDLASYLGSDFSNTVFVTTGHSRGAAVSNLLAVKLTSVGVSGSNIYSYNFACPDVAAASGYQWNPNGKYNNIINIGHAGDPVAVLPGKVGNLFQLGSFFSSQWGKFGRSYWYAFDWHNPGELMLDLSFGAHNMELYLQYMRYRNSLSSYKTWEETQSVWTLPLGLLFGIACPVDVTVTDENGTIVASVINGVADYHGNTNGNVLIMTDGDEKIIYVKDNQALTVNLVATSEGTMNYTVAAIDDSGLVASEKTFENVALTTGKEMKSDVNVTDNSSTPDMSDVPLYVVGNEGDIVKEVLPDGTGTEVELKTITFDANGGSVSTATAKTNAEGKLLSLPTPTRSSYDFDGWYTSSTGGDKITTTTVFTQDTTVYAHWTKSSSGGSTGGGGGGAVSEYTIKFETNGGNEITAVKVSKNNTITAPVTPTKEGYTFDGWYTDKELSTKYDFAEKITKSFTLYAKWVESANDNTEWVNSFNDVNENDWYYETVKAVCEQGLMKGISDTEFAPNDNITRGMFVTLLYRAENEPVAPKLNFNDVPSGQYYTEAIAWASANNIVSGISDTEFAPNNNITREQIATILHRYAQYKTCDISIGEDTNILSYNDADKMSEYAIPALQWAVGSGIISGKGNGILDPIGNATRAETATMLIRFINTIK